jgi:hypothetical protein
MQQRGIKMILINYKISKINKKSDYNKKKKRNKNKHECH